ncbi:hypothetical protein HNI00_07240 [Thermoleptolyngbya oregonensis NK1-22]|uniref:Uncharacterized protein n=1 Tax=Thermoleptolyngbya oregonensis NK1-22 TaxID=2547457 RepID=A0AA97B9P3_9CYAN|nr:hypothetical protein [Thermoleptolyngbya oregonensis]WOB42970.1 hypothetical protein HNI00_07240 [Thermoleptolyngbya oregonensis NK1-22]
MIEIVATLIGILAGIVGTFLSVQGHMRSVRKDYQARLDAEFQRQADAKVKEYAAQRDFEHLKRHHEQLKALVLELQKDEEALKDEVLELKVLSKGAFARIEQIAARLEGGNTGGTPRQ